MAGAPTAVSITLWAEVDAMPFILLIVAVIAVIVLAVMGGRRSRSSRAGGTSVAGDSGVASTTEPDDVGTL